MSDLKDYITIDVYVVFITIDVYVVFMTGCVGAPDNGRKGYATT